MKLPECNVREKLATFNQLKIFLYTLVVNHGPLFENLFPFLEPRMYPYRAKLNLSGSSPKHVEAKNEWRLKFISRTKYIRSGTSHKKWQFFLDYCRETPEDLACCSHGLRRLIVSGGMKFFHTEATPLGESYTVLASGEWPSGSVGLGLYLASEYSDAKVSSLGDIKNLVRYDREFNQTGAVTMNP